jgi:hypothetical protein
VAFPLYQQLLRWLRPQQDETSAGYVQAGMTHAVLEAASAGANPPGKQRDYSIWATLGLY